MRYATRLQIIPAIKKERKYPVNVFVSIPLMVLLDENVAKIKKVVLTGILNLVSTRRMIGANSWKKLKLSGCGILFNLP